LKKTIIVTVNVQICEQTGQQTVLNTNLLKQLYK